MPENLNGINIPKPVAGCNDFGLEVFEPVLFFENVQRKYGGCWALEFAVVDVAAEKVENGYGLGVISVAKTGEI